MTKRVLSIVVMSMLSTWAYADQCPEIATGYYGLNSPAEVNVKQLNDSEVSGWTFVGDTDIDDAFQNGATIPITSRDTTLNLGRNYITFILDGQDHLWDTYPKADNYYRKYRASCTGNSIIIDEDGSNNNTSLKRVDTYNAHTVITVVSPNHLSVVRTGNMYDQSGALSIQGSEKLDIIKK